MLRMLLQDNVLHRANPSKSGKALAKAAFFSRGTPVFLPKRPIF
jgi:hypothetical protein